MRPCASAPARRAVLLWRPPPPFSGGRSCRADLPMPRGAGPLAEHECAGPVSYTHLRAHETSAHL
eukprot:10684345-Alexandrium_andersonii.AAC.1